MVDKASHDFDTALFQSLDSMEGFGRFPIEEPKLPGSYASMMATVYSIYPGLIAALTIAIAASWLSQNYHAPIMVFALLLGIAFAFLSETERCKAGIGFSSKTVLRAGVALLGLRISADQIIDLGFVPIISVICGVITTMAFGYFISRRMHLRMEFGLLSGGAVAICGASAALAISTALPHYEQRERDTILTVIAVTTMSTIAMLVYPSIASWLALTDVQAGVFIGGTIHDVAQVVGAGYIISQKAGDISTYVKLLRVALLVPVVITLSYVLLRGNPGGQPRRLPQVPFFLIAFVSLVALNSAIKIPNEVHTAAMTASNWFLVTAISALGMKTSFRELARVGWRPVILMVGETVWIAVLVLSIIAISRSV